MPLLFEFKSVRLKWKARTFNIATELLENNATASSCIFAAQWALIARSRFITQFQRFENLDSDTHSGVEDKTLPLVMNKLADSICTAFIRAISAFNESTTREIRWQRYLCCNGIYCTRVIDPALNLPGCKYTTKFFAASDPRKNKQTVRTNHQNKWMLVGGLYCRYCFPN